MSSFHLCGTSSGRLPTRTVDSAPDSTLLGSHRPRGGRPAAICRPDFLTVPTIVRVDFESDRIVVRVQPNRLGRIGTMVNRPSLRPSRGRVPIFREFSDLPWKPPLALTPDRLLDALRTVRDPDLGKDLVTLGMIKRHDGTIKKRIKEKRKSKESG